MYLAAAEQRLDLLGKDPARPPCSAKWEHFPFSVLSHHGSDCCETARQWVIAMDFAQLNGGDLTSGPRWLRQTYEWGPSVWPLHWCEAVEAKVIDCGAHAALAHEAFQARGVTSFRAQFVQSYSPEAVAQWRCKWAEGKASDHWLDEDFIYHEGNAVLAGADEVKLWDGSAGCWINPRQAAGYGSLLAVRIFTGGQPGGDRAAGSGGDKAGGLRWGQSSIVPDIWNHFD